jgi:hypothetical protein
MALDGIAKSVDKDTSLEVCVVLNMQNFIVCVF